MASTPPLKDNAPLTGRGTDPRGLTLADLARMSPHEQMMASLAITGEDAKLAEQGPMLRPAQEVSDPWGLRLRDLIKKKGFPLYSSLTLGQMMGAQNA